MTTPTKKRKEAAQSKAERKINSNSITTKRIPRGRWARHIKAALPDVRGFVWVDNLVADCLQRLQVEGHGAAFWIMNKLSNGGFYLAPDPKFSRKKVTLCAPNGTERTITPDTAGIVATLYTLGMLSFRFPSAGDAYYRLYDYALEHADALDIYQLID
jgi:Antirestriction protein